MPRLAKKDHLMQYTAMQNLNWISVVFSFVFVAIYVPFGNNFVHEQFKFHQEHILFHLEEFLCVNTLCSLFKNVPKSKRTKTKPPSRIKSFHLPSRPTFCLFASMIVVKFEGHKNEDKGHMIYPVKKIQVPKNEIFHSKIWVSGTLNNF